MRESYRLQKEALFDACHSFDVSVDCVFMYKGRLTDHDRSFHSVNVSMTRIIEMMVDLIPKECVE